MPIFGNGRINSKTACICHCRVRFPMWGYPALFTSALFLAANTMSQTTCRIAICNGFLHVSVGLHQIMHPPIRNFVCQHTVMAETTVKRQAFAFIMFDFQNWDTQLFSAVNTRLWRHPPRAGIPPDCGIAERRSWHSFPGPFNLIKRSVADA